MGKRTFKNSLLMKVVLDTNCLLVSIAHKSYYRPIFDALIKKKYSLIICNEILLEYEEIITEKSNSTIAKNISDLLLILPNVEKKHIYFRWNLINNDPNDNKFVDCALAGMADCIVSNDHHFNVLKKISFPKLKIITLKEFYQMLKKIG